MLLVNPIKWSPACTLRILIYQGPLSSNLPVLTYRFIFYLNPTEPCLYPSQTRLQPVDRFRIQVLRVLPKTNITCPDQVRVSTVTTPTPRT